MDIACAGCLKSVELAKLLACCRGEYIILQNFVELSVGFFSPQKAEKAVTGWEQGRVFGGDLEIRWEKAEERIHFMYAGKKENAPPGDWEKTLDLSQAVSVTRSFYLWGTRITGKNQWRDYRIPRLLVYPVKEENSRQVKLEIVEYWDPEKNSLLLSRFTGIKGVNS